VALTANFSSANGPVFPGVTKDCSGGTGVSPVAVFDARCYFPSLATSIQQMEPPNDIIIQTKLTLTLTLLNPKASSKMQICGSADLRIFKRVK